MSHKIREKTDALDAAGDTCYWKAMLPHWSSNMTMKSVGIAALTMVEMVEEVPRQFNTIPGFMEGTAKPDYANCVKISTNPSIKEMIPPSALLPLLITS
ncbi:hypothetical protein MKW94_030902 [Papaver nudicaule]|uniref:H(+)-exporting diphosphatase n=1 Tax=Papaver nudicaule TaxID=74823 RepID=A0AA41UZS1_PAPNU|nr:hypothetical protein [Papaver nudicaule]